MDVLYFSRGRGYGHALADIDLSRQLTGWNIQFVSYGTGLSVFRRRGVACIDLGLPDGNAFCTTLECAYEVIAAQRPALIIAREEFAPLVAARLNNLPAILLTDWLPPPGSVLSEACEMASWIFVTEEAGIFALSRGVGPKATFVGPVQRDWAAQRNPETIRAMLKVGPHEKIVLVVMGGAYNEGRYPVQDIILEAAAQIRTPNVRMVWVDGEKSARLRAAATHVPNLMVLNFVDPIEDYIAVSDAVITKATRGVTRDAGCRGVPTVSISLGDNPVDDVVIPRIRTNRAFNIGAIDGTLLAETIDSVLGEGRLRPLVMESSAAIGGALAQRMRELLGQP